MATLEIWSNYQTGQASDHCTARITLEPKSIDKDATLSVVCEVEVKDTRAVNKSRVLFTKTFRTTSANMEVEMPARFDRAYSYAGQQIDIVIKVKLVVNDALIFDSKAEDVMPKHALQKPTIISTAKKLADPKDFFSLAQNFRAISPIVKITATVLLVVFGVSLTAQSFFPNVGLWGSIFFLSLLAGILNLLRLSRSYMTFEQHPNLKIDKDRFYTVGDLIRGQARIPLNHAQLRVVGYNMEKGQYRRGHGTQTRLVSFSNPVNGVMLYDKTVDHIPARTQIADSFPGHVAFDDMFRQLYPPQLVGSYHTTRPEAGTHGLATHWEVQLILDDLVDQEVIGDNGSLRYEDFLDG